MAGVVIEETETLQQLANVAVQALARLCHSGEETVKSAALASRDVLPLRISSANVMGVRVTQIEQTRSARLPHDRGYSIIGTSTTLDEAAGAFEAEVDMIIQLAESELRLRRLIGEIQWTSRRVNALKNILIPQLESEIQYIQMTLDERERADHFRLKLTKRVLEHRRAPSRPRSQGGQWAAIHGDHRALLERPDHVPVPGSPGPVSRALDEPLGPQAPAARREAVPVTVFLVGLREGAAIADRAGGEVERLDARGGTRHIRRTHSSARLCSLMLPTM